MSLENFLKTRMTSEETEKVRALNDLRDSLRPAVDYATKELKNIEAALREVDAWIKTNLGGIPSKKLPRFIGELLLRLEGPRGNPPVIRQALKEYDALTIKNIWGNRPE